MDLINLVGKDTTEDKIKELKELGVELSPEQIESLKYEAIGRGLTQKTNVLHAESGAVVTTDFFDALIVTAVSQCTTKDLFIINRGVQPLYNIQNEYMGFLFYGTIRNLKKEKRRTENIRKILHIIAMISMFIIGMKASLFIIMLSVIAIVTFGFASFMLGRDK